ncbi:hypothetical protein JCM10213_009141 [Rhodosporidiobolus nylandii]
MLRLPSFALALSFAATLAAAQTADQVSADQITLSANIPDVCTADCASWFAAINTCPGPTDDAAYAACVCDATYQGNLNTCSTCFSTNADPNAGIATTAADDLTGYCANAGAAVSSSSSSSSSSTETTSTTEAATSTSAVEAVASTISTSSDSISSVSSTTALGVSTNKLTQGGVEFPTQTKSTNVFTGAASGSMVGAGQMVGVAAAGLAAAAGGMMLF